MLCQDWFHLNLLSSLFLYIIVSKKSAQHYVVIMPYRVHNIHNNGTACLTSQIPGYSNSKKKHFLYLLRHLEVCFKFIGCSSPPIVVVFDLMFFGFLCIIYLKRVVTRMANYPLGPNALIYLKFIMWFNIFSPLRLLGFKYICEDSSWNLIFLSWIRMLFYTFRNLIDHILLQ